MNTPALAPVLPTPSPSPAAPGPSAPRDGEPSAFARELQSASAGGDNAEPPADEAREAAGDEARADGRGADAGPATPAARPVQPGAARGTLERWLAMGRIGGADRGADDAEARIETPADGDAAKAVPGTVDDEASAPEAAALLAALLPRQPDDKAPGTMSEGDARARSLRGNLQPAGEARTDGTEGISSGVSTWFTDASRLAPEANSPPAEVPLEARQAAGLGDGNGFRLAPEANSLPAAMPLAARQAAGRGDDPGLAGALAAAQALEGAEGRGGAARAAGLSEDPAAGGLVVAGTPAAASPALPAFAAELARAGQAVAGGTPTPAAGNVNLPTPVHAADFMPRLSGELAVLARDGVQEARVHVNPAELGPIAVQITLDGTAAQVRLAVEHAQTRDLLEQGMPTLAAALRENGLTLTGGGVFQQARDPGRDAQGGQDPSARGGSGDARDGGRDGGREALAAAAPARRIRHPGQVDVYA